jgi:hypothetical protein
MLASLSCVDAQAQMWVGDLERFVIDCRIKHQQMAFLESMRTTPDQELQSRVANQLQFWKVITEPATYHQRHNIGSGRVDWLVNQLMLDIRNNCP